MRLIHNMFVRGRLISIGLQVYILNSHHKKIDKFEVVSVVRDWLNCSQSESIRIVESVIGVCTFEKVAV